LEWKLDDFGLLFASVWHNAATENQNSNNRSSSSSNSSNKKTTKSTSVRDKQQLGGRFILIISMFQ